MANRYNRLIRCLRVETETTTINKKTSWYYKHFLLDFPFLSNIPKENEITWN